MNDDEISELLACDCERYANVSMNVSIFPYYVSSQDEILSPKFDDESDVNSERGVSNLGGVCDHKSDVNTCDDLSDLKSITKGSFNSDPNSLHADHVAISFDVSCQEKENDRNYNSDFEFPFFADESSDMFHVMKRRMIEVVILILSFHFFLMSLVMMSLKDLNFIPTSFV